LAPLLAQRLASWVTRSFVLREMAACL
jgi:hypothetical protein